jgi:hypothetical protein
MRVAHPAPQARAARLSGTTSTHHEDKASLEIVK